MTSAGFGTFSSGAASRTIVPPARASSTRAGRLGCNRQPASPARPSRAGRCGGQGGCGGPLAAAIPPGCTGLLAARRAHDAISGLLTGIRDPGRTPVGRSQALGQLTDITLIAYHLAADRDPRHRTRQEFTPSMLDAGTITTAFTLLTAHPGTGGHDRLASLVTGTAPAAIPRTWRPASPALHTRIARARDPSLSPSDRLRYATTLAIARPPVPRPHGEPDLTAARAARLPDQLWPDWAIRLTDDGASRHDKFLPAALIALLLPHSDMPLNQVTTLVNGQLRRHVTGYHLSKLTAQALRILTELALAIDAHHIPVSYRRRRDLAASATLIDQATWTTMIREARMRMAPTGNARRYLYELLTGCSLSTAPRPYRLSSTESHGRYNDFVLGHARQPGYRADRARPPPAHRLGSR